MDLRQLDYVVAVAEELNFTRAAARCHIVQSGLSSQIAKLEREVGAALFERSSRAVRLTAAGEALLPRARSALDAVARARSEIAAMSGTVHGTLRLGVIPVDHGSIDLPAVLQTYHRRYPQVGVVVSDTGSLAMVSMLQAGEMDVAILGLAPDQLPESLATRLLRIEPLVAVVGEGHPAGRRDRIGLAELATTGEFIECHHDSGLRNQVDLAFVRAHTNRRITFELGNLLDVARMASLGLGVAVVPASVAGALGSDPDRRFTVLELEDAHAVQPVTLVSQPAGTCSAAAQAFVDLFADVSMSA